LAVRRGMSHRGRRLICAWNTDRRSWIEAITGPMGMPRSISTTPKVASWPRWFPAPRRWRPRRYSRAPGGHRGRGPTISRSARSHARRHSASARVSLSSPPGRGAWVQAAGGAASSRRRCRPSRPGGPRRRSAATRSGHCRWRHRRLRGTSQHRRHGLAHAAEAAMNNALGSSVGRRVQQQRDRPARPREAVGPARGRRCAAAGSSAWSAPSANSGSGPGRDRPGATRRARP